jgi:energy-coupling factor transporter ATP-binding protein EcfA2
LEARRQQRAEKLLLVGHRGCGKSTELNQLVSELADAYLALNFDLLLATGRTTIGYEDLM